MNMAITPDLTNASHSGYLVIGNHRSVEQGAPSPVIFMVAAVEVDAVVGKLTQVLR